MALLGGLRRYAAPAKLLAKALAVPKENELHAATTGDNGAPLRLPSATSCRVAYPGLDFPAFDGSATADHRTNRTAPIRGYVHLLTTEKCAMPSFRENKVLLCRKIRSFDG